MTSSTPTCPTTRSCARCWPPTSRRRCAWPTPPSWATTQFFSAGMDAIGAGLPKLLTGRDLAGFTERQEAFIARDVPVPLAERVAAMVPAYSAFDVVEIAAATGRDIEETAEVYFDLADRLQIARLRDQIVALPRDDR